MNGWQVVGIVIFLAIGAGINMLSNSTDSPTNAPVDPDHYKLPEDTSRMYRGMGAVKKVTMSDGLQCVVVTSSVTAHGITCNWELYNKQNEKLLNNPEQIK